MSRVNDMPVKDLKDIKWSGYGNYNCPQCKEDHPLTDTSYRRKGKKYPERYNHTIGFNGNGDFDDWDEVHYCRKCKIEYWFTNGAY